MESSYNSQYGAMCNGNTITSGSSVHTVGGTSSNHDSLAPSSASSSNASPATSSVASVSPVNPANSPPIVSNYSSASTSGYIDHNGTTISSAASEGAQTLLRLASSQTNRLIVNQSERVMIASPATTASGPTAATTSSCSSVLDDSSANCNKSRPAKRPHSLNLDATPARKRPAYHLENVSAQALYNMPNGPFAGGALWTPNGPLPAESLQSPELEMLKLGTPDLERLFTSGPTPLQSADTLQNALCAFASKTTVNPNSNTATSNSSLPDVSSQQVDGLMASDAQSATSEMLVTQEQVQYAKGFEIALQQRKNADQSAKQTGSEVFVAQNGIQMQSNTQMFSNPTNTFHAGQSSMHQMQTNRQRVSNNSNKMSSTVSNLNETESGGTSLANNILQDSAILVGSGNSQSLGSSVVVSQPSNHVQLQPFLCNQSHSANPMDSSFTSQANCTSLMSSSTPYIKQEKSDADDSGFVTNSMYSHMYPHDLCHANNDNNISSVSSDGAAHTPAVVAAVAKLAGAGLLSLPSNSCNTANAGDCTNGDYNSLLYDSNAYGALNELQYNLNPFGQGSGLNSLNGLAGLNQIEAANLLSNNLLSNSTGLANGTLMNSSNEASMQASILPMVSSQNGSVSQIMSGNPISPINMDEQDRCKLERKRLRNRIAASKCRKRKLERISKLEEKVHSLKCDYNELEKVTEKYRNRIAFLKAQLMQHLNSGCNINPALISDH